MRQNTTSAFTALRLIQPTMAGCPGGPSLAGISAGSAGGDGTESDLGGESGVDGLLEAVRGDTGTDQAVRLGLERLSHGRLAIRVVEGPSSDLRLEMLDDRGNWRSAPADAGWSSQGRPAWVIDTSRFGRQRFFRVAGPATEPK